MSIFDDFLDTDQSMDKLPDLNKTDLESSTTNDTGNPSLEEDPAMIDIVDQDTLHPISSENLLEENSLLGSDLDLNESFSSDESEILSRLAEEDNDGNFWFDSDESSLLREEDVEQDVLDVLNLEAVPVEFESSLLLSEDSDTEDLEMSKLMDAENRSTFAMDSQALDAILIDNSEREVNESHSIDCGSSTGYDISAEEENRLLSMDVSSSVQEEANVQSTACSSGVNVLRDDSTRGIEVKTFAQVHVPLRQVVAGPSEIRRSFSDVQLATCSNVSSLSCKRKADRNKDRTVEEDSSDDELLFTPIPRAQPRRKRRRVNDDMFIKMLTPCDELRFMARDLHFNWISIDEAEKKMRDIFDRARTEMEFWRKRNVDCSKRALIQTCGEESILQLVYTSMSLPANESGKTRNAAECIENIDCSTSTADKNPSRQFCPTNLAKNSAK